jgi:hypothetical protein
VRLSWEASGDPESQIVHYAVRRDGAEICRTKALSYQDAGLAEAGAYAYSVEAMNLWGLFSRKAGPLQVATPPDTTPPAIVSVTARPTRITVRYDEPVEQASATAVSNYAVDHGVVVSRAQLARDDKAVIVILTVSALTPGVDYTLTVNQVRDRAKKPNTIAAGTAARFTVPNSIVLVDFGATAAENTFELAGWNKVRMDGYAGYGDAGLGGIMDGICGSDYNHQGVSGTPREFTAQERIVVTWYNKSANPVTFTPKISFDQPGRVEAGGKWHAMSPVTIPAYGSGVAEFAMSADAGAHSLVNVASSRGRHDPALICDKIELFLK